MDRDGYQLELSVSSPILLDEAYKRSKVTKMLAVLEDAGAIATKDGTVAVDVGCSRGFFAKGIAEFFGQVIGIDIDGNALGLAASENNHVNLTYILSDSMTLPLPDCSVDLVICNHVYEHVPSPERLFREIHRVLRVNGKCYFGAASRLIVVEPHYHLPFLSWLPKPLANAYMRVMKRGEHYYENLRTLSGILALPKGFKVVDYTLRILGNPDRFCARDVIPAGGWIDRMPKLLWRWCYPLLPTYIFILEKQ